MKTARPCGLAFFIFSYDFDLNFNEGSNASWESTQFIGRTDYKRKDIRTKS
jgi:hypothetical protein